MEVIPAILENNWEEIEKKINIAKQFCDTVHIDFIDGKFAQNTTFLDPKPFAQYSKDLFLEAHLMVDEPKSFLKGLSDAGFKRFLGHVEKMSGQTDFVAEAQILGEVGLAIDAKTSLEQIKVPFEDLDAILVMTINAGSSGQKFMPELLEKIKKIRLKNPLNSQGENLPIEVDGGINKETIIMAKNAGASVFCANSCIFKSGSPADTYSRLVKTLGENMP